MLVKKSGLAMRYIGRFDESHAPRTPHNTTLTQYSRPEMYDKLAHMRHRTLDVKREAYKETTSPSLSHRTPTQVPSQGSAVIQVENEAGLARKFSRNLISAMAAHTKKKLFEQNFAEYREPVSYLFWTDSNSNPLS